jgi:PAS domain S-box-containing protein
MSVKLFKNRLTRFARRIPLRTIAIASLVLPVVGTVGLVGYLSYSNQQKVASKLADRLIDETSDRVEEQLKHYLSVPKQLEGMNLQAIEAGLLDLNDLESTGKFFWSQLQNFDLKSISYSDRQQEFIGVGYFKGQLEIVERSQPNLDRIHAYAPDERGNRDRAIAVYNRKNPNPSLLRPWADGESPQTLAAGQKQWSASYPQADDPTQGAIALNSPVYSNAQTFMGTIRIEIGLDRLNRSLRAIDIGRGKILILERSGLLAASSSVPALDRADRATVQALRERSGNLKAIQTAQQLRVQIEGQPQWVRLMPYQDKYGLDWLIAIAIPESEFAGPRKARVRNTLVLWIAILGGATASAIAIERGIVTPTIRLSQAAKGMTQGDWQKTIALSRVEELGQLAESFNRMAQHIQQSDAALRESETELVQFLQALPIAAIAIDPNGQPHYVNPKAVDILGVNIALNTAPEKFAQTYQIYKAGTNEEYPGQDLPLALALKGEDRYIDDAEIRRGQESVFLEVWGSPIYDIRGNITYGLIAFRNITQRRRSEHLIAEYNQFLEEQVRERTQELAAKNLELEREIQERRAAQRELQQAEQVARESEAKFAGIVQIAEDAIISADEHQRIQLFNHGAEKIFGYEAAEAIGQPLDILLPTEVRERHQQYVKNFGRSNAVAYRGMGKSDRSTIRGRRKNGEEFPAEASISKLYTKHGQIFTVILNDITERQQIEAALRQSEQRFRSAFETAALGVCLISPAGKFLQVNAALGKMLGYSEAELLSTDIEEITYSEDLESDLHYIQRTLAGEIPGFDTEKRYWHKNGHLIWTRVSAALVQDESDRPLYFIAQIQDITDRKVAEAALQEKERYLRLILNNIPQQVFWKDTNLVFQGCNANWAEAAGLEGPAAVIGKTDYDLLPQRDLAEAFRARDRQIIETGTPELHVIAKKVRPGPDGKIIWLDINKMPIRDAQGNVIGLLGVLEDITLRKQAEEALHIEQLKSDRLLRNILPEEIVKRLKQDQSAIAEQFDAVTILFADIVGFTPLAASMSPTDLVALLNQIFSRFDKLADLNGLEKIKTIGDAYLAVGGLPLPKPDHAEAVAEMALGMQEAIADFADRQGQPLSLRIGIHTGSVVAGVIGQRKFIYDLWGDAVNIASRMESLSLPGKIQVTAQTYDLLYDRYELEERGTIAIKGRGEMMTYWLMGRKAIARTV